MTQRLAPIPQHFHTISLWVQKPSSQNLRFAVPNLKSPPSNYNSQLQGDTERWPKPPVDFKNKSTSLAWTGQARTGQNGTFVFEVNGRFWLTFCVTMYVFSYRGGVGTAEYIPPSDSGDIWGKGGFEVCERNLGSLEGNGPVRYLSFVKRKRTPLKRITHVILVVW